jgi:hypothetical protein
MIAMGRLISPVLGLSLLALTAIGCAAVTSISADDPLSVTNPTTTPNIALGVVPVAKGGTGLSSAGAAGHLLRSDGSAWTTAALTAPDLPAGSAQYIQNSTSQQIGANFNIEGTGTASILNAVTQFDLGGSRILGSAGAGNLFAGRGSGFNNTLGSSNSFFGISAGLSNNTGGRNSFFGESAGQNNTSGSGNSFFGVFAGANNRTSAENSFFGKEAGFFNTTGNANSFFGEGAGIGNTVGSMNSFFGKRAGHSNSIGTNNTFIGANAGNPSFSTQVSDSTAIGVGATVSTNNTIVIGRSTETTRIPGKLIMGGGAIVGGGVVESFDIGPLEGLFTSNIVLTGLNALQPSPVRLCIRTTSLGGGFGGEGLTRCTPSLSSLNNKTDVQPFSSGLDLVSRLKPVSFKWRGDGTRDIGLNAEDVAEIEPLLVTRGDDGHVAEVKEGSLTVLFINAFKEQQTQIQQQQQQIEKQHLEIETLKKRQQEWDALKSLVCADHPVARVCNSN